MTNSSATTIVAIATAPQNGAIGVVRLSGPEAKAILQMVFVKPSGVAFETITPRYMHLGKILAEDGTCLDEAMGVYMPGPKSFTGEDVVELHCHGNLILLRAVLERLLRLSVTFDIRAAEPGEFTKRAFLNGRLDLTQAEAVHDLITAGSEQALKASLSNLDGALKRHIESLREELTVSLALVEASFEFPEEDIQTFDRPHVMALVRRIREDLSALAQAHATSKLYDHGVSVALVGRPNVGKSSLLNAILVEERAIVTEIAGTTRDVVEGAKILGGVRFVFRDTAGLRETSDCVENAGIQRSREWIQKSDLVLWISDDPMETPVFDFPLPSGSRIYRILNKVDRISSFPSDVLKNFDFLVSAWTREGLDRLEAALLDFLARQQNVQNFVHINARQFLSLTDVLKSMERILALDVRQDLSEEILAEELRYAIRGLKEMTGEITNDAVLGEIFRRFCIGK